MRRGNKNYQWSDRCFTNQEELLEFFGSEMIKDLNADAVCARKVETLTAKDEKELIKLNDVAIKLK